MPSIFSRIVNRDLPAHIVAESDEYLAFLDISPLAEGHTLVIPKKEEDYIFDLDDETYEGAFRFAKKVGKAIEKVIPCERMGLTVIGLEVPHAHIHLIPINAVDDMNFGRVKLSPTNEELAATALKIKNSFKELY